MSALSSRRDYALLARVAAWRAEEGTAGLAVSTDKRGPAVRHAFALERACVSVLYLNTQLSETEQESSLGKHG